MKETELDPFDPFNIGHHRYRVTIKIAEPFYGIVGAGMIRGRAVRIKVRTGPDTAQWYPNGSKIGIWLKGSPADIEYEIIPPELKVVDIRHIDSFQIDINQM